ncbi:MAG: hypothetical protein AVDCRST_MAG18-4246 [uncultured Thermomicrobiales bacterium]|uniref:Uncharacterized protein n=1 Tax=uncultured Thermomicrobiales bacterium TaxID=1645740 RepID=A0A6J4VSX0_9BACT|nr:MAG: hypothetical protein AVDCRST_MAG18-4246 [uncultured Thermomicrobiales bacterium]
MEAGSRRGEGYRRAERMALRSGVGAYCIRPHVVLPPTPVETWA